MVSERRGLSGYLRDPPSKKRLVSLMTGVVLMKDGLRTAWTNLDGYVSTWWSRNQPLHFFAARGQKVTFFQTLHRMIDLNELVRSMKLFSIFHSWQKNKVKKTEGVF